MAKKRGKAKRMATFKRFIKKSKKPKKEVKLGSNLKKELTNSNKAPKLFLNSQFNVF